MVNIVTLTTHKPLTFPFEILSLTPCLVQKMKKNKIIFLFWFIHIKNLMRRNIKVDNCFGPKIRYYRAMLRNFYLKLYHWNSVGNAFILIVSQ